MERILICRAWERPLDFGPENKGKLWKILN